MEGGGAGKLFLQSGKRLSAGSGHTFSLLWLVCEKKCKKAKAERDYGYFSTIVLAGLGAGWGGSEGT